MAVAKRNWFYTGITIIAIVDQSGLNHLALLAVIDYY